MEGTNTNPSSIQEFLISQLPKCDFIIMLAICATAFVKPTNSNFIYSVFPCHNALSYILFCILEGFTMCHIYVSGNFIFLFVTYYVLSTRFWLRRVGIRLVILLCINILAYGDFIYFCFQNHGILAR